MDLLPSTSEEFSSESYWDRFFNNLKDDAFEWYGEYPELAELLHKYMSVKDNVLITGCGNSTMSFCLHKAGIVKQTNIDISSVVVNQMTKTYPDLTILQEDVTKMDKFDNDAFTCVLDKGTFDALTPPPSKNKDKDAENSEKTKSELMLEEISRVLKEGGRFVCISLLQPHVADRLFSYFTNAGWMIRVVRCTAVEEKALKSSSDRVVFPLFMNVFTKVKLPPTIKPVIEASCGSSFIRLKDLDDLLSYIVNQQNMMQLRRELMNIGVAGSKEVVLRLVSKEGEDRFVFYVTDAMKLIKNPVEKRFGVFIVPQGRCELHLIDRETEWLFGTHEGRIQLAHESNFTRLVVVHFVRGQKYESMGKVQEEIAGHIQFMMPRSVSERNIRAPIMTIGNDVGTRTIRHAGKSEFSGDFVVEDVLADGDQYSRRLIFLSNPNVIQSEVGISAVKKKGKELTVFKRTLACEHHQIMSIAFGLLQKFFKYDGQLDSLLVGLGGGLLASFLIDFIPNIKLTAVEIDDAIVKVARDFFGLPKEDDRFSVVVDDGLRFIQNSESAYNVILFDVDNKSVTEGLSCPPPAFVEKAFLEQVKSKLKPDAGILVVNLVCRNPKLKEKYMEEIASVFPTVYSYQVGSDLNNILFCFASVPAAMQKQWNNTLKASIEWLDNVITKKSTASKNSNKKSSGGYEWTKDQLDEVFDADIDFIRDRFKLMKTTNS